jgi:spoIIIJ-associated protein
MNDKRASLEVIAPTVDEAMEKGLNDLGMSEDQVEVEILDEGSRGLFGLGARQARIRLTIKSSSEEIKLPLPVQPIEAPAAPEHAQPQAVSPRRTPAPPPPVSEIEEEEVEEEIELEPVGEDDGTLRVARETVQELLEKMKVRARVTARFGEAEDARSRVPILVEVSGNDLSILIGRQAETLNALQYIANLMIGKELGKSVPVVIDVEGYRQRRAQQIRQLARRMADQAVKTGRRQILEPMPANERRLIHLELRDHPEVMTESVGEEPRRKVTIVPK